MITRLPEIRPWPLSHQAAMEFIRVAHSVVEYLETYRALFPQDYQRSMDAIAASRASLLPRRKEIYAPHEVHFLSLIHRTKFPLGDLKERLANAEQRWYFVPFDPIGWDDWYHYDLSRSDRSWLLLLYLAGEIEEETLAEHFYRPGDDPLLVERQVATIISTPWKPYVNHDRLERACQREQGPISAFKVALDVTTHNTGNIWLDYTSDMTLDEDLCWDVATVTSLADQFPPARLMVEQAIAFIVWLEADLMPRFQEIVNIWNNC